MKTSWFIAQCSLFNLTLQLHSLITFLFVVGFEKFKVCQKAIRKVNYLKLVSTLSHAFQSENERVNECPFYALFILWAITEWVFYALGARKHWEGILVSPCPASFVVRRRRSSLYLFFSKSLPLLFQSVDREVNKNTQWKFWNFLTTFKVFRPKNWKIVKNFKIELVPQFCLDPKESKGLVRYMFWPKKCWN